MSTAIQKTANAPLAIAEGWTREQVNVIKQVCAADASDTELAMFLHVAKTAGLDPLQKQIYFVKRRVNTGTREQPKWEERVTIQAGVDGLQARAERNPDFLGSPGAVVCEKDEVHVEMDTATDEVTRIVHKFNPFGNRGNILGAWCAVKRKGKVPCIALVQFSEYNDARSFLWKDKPRVMIEKVARSTALRRAYPEAFGGIYDPAEMGKDAASEAVEAPAAPTAPAPPSLPSPAPKSEPVVVHDPVDEHPDQTRRAAHAIVDAAAQAQPSLAVPSQTKAQQDRAKMLWKRASNAKTHNMTWAIFVKWAADGLKSQKPYTEWTDEDMDTLTALLDQAEDVK